MEPTKVIIVGCGIAGPVLGSFLKSKGYSPIIYERVERNSDATGISLMLQSNGLRVLDLLPGFDVSAIPSQTIDTFTFRSWIPEAQVSLASSSVPSLSKDRFGFQIRGAERPELQQMLIETAQKNGVEIKWGHQLVSLEQGDDEVVVRFANGASDTASFVIGCDGLHSNTRISLFGRERADFTGCAQTAGVTIVDDLESKGFAMSTIFGNGTTLISYPISSNKVAWAVTQQEPEERETWRAMDQQKQDEFKRGPLAEWGFEGETVVKNAHRIVKYGLYDRPELASWHKDRVALLGDAAHPTSPHLGQGANQALEDIYHLVRLLVKHNPTAAPLPTDKLSAIFKEYEGLRIPRTSTLVRGARQMGELRSTSGLDACLARNDLIKRMYANDERMLEQAAYMLDAPFKGTPEI